MALRQSGLDLVIRGASSFFANLGKVQSGYQKVGDAANKVTDKIQRVALAAEASARRQANALSSHMQAQMRLASATDRLVGAQARLNAIDKDAEDAALQLAIATAAVERAATNEVQAVLAAQKAWNNYATAADNAQMASEKLADAQEAETDASGDAVSGILELVMSYTSVGQKASQFITAIKGVATALGPTGAAIAGVVTALGAMVFVIAKVVGGLYNLAKTALGVVVSALRGIANAAKSVLDFFTRLAGGILRSVGDSFKRVFDIFLGLSLYNAIQNISDAIKNMADEVFEAAVTFQALELRLNSLLARDYAQAFGGDMEQAIKATTGATQELFDWMRRLAVQSPFDFEDIAKVYTMSEAMGITGETAKRLTGAIINFTSAMGLTGETMWRIIYNFGQMIQRGKLSGEEFRDLARNFVPIDIIMTNLAKKAGMTKDAFRELALEGGVPVNAFLEEFMEMTERDWAGASIRMSKTFQAVLDNIKEFIKLFIGMDVIKPVLDRISGIMADFLDNLTENVTMMNSFKLIGQALLKAFEALIEPAGILVDAFGELAKAIGFASGETLIMTGDMRDSIGVGVRVAAWAKQLAVNIIALAMVIGKMMTLAAKKITDFSKNGNSALQNFATKAKQWGYNLIVTFVNGISMALGLLTKAMKMIGDILAKWLMGHSPPLVAPDVDQWGADLMNEYIKGFMLADFDMFNDIAGLMEDFFRSIEDKIGEENLIPRILGARADIASSLAAVRNGTLSVAAAINRMVQSLGDARPEFRSYIASLFYVADAQRKLALASDAVKRAQEAVNLVSKRYEGILAALRKQLTQVTTFYSEEVRLREINEALASNLLTDEERERLEMEKKAIEIERQIRTIEEQRDAEIAIAEAKLAAAQAAEDAARAELELAQARADALRQQIEIMIEQNELMKEQEELLKKIAEALENIEEADDEYPLESLLAAGGEAENLFGNLDGLMAEAAKKADEMWASLEKLFSGMGTDTPLGKAINSVKESFDGLVSLWENTFVEGGIVDGVTTKLGEIWVKIKDLLDIPADQSFLDWLIDKLLKLAGTVIVLAGQLAIFGFGILEWLNDIVIVPFGSIGSSLSMLAGGLIEIAGAVARFAGLDGPLGNVGDLSMTLIDLIKIVAAGPLYALATALRVVAESGQAFAKALATIIILFDGLKDRLLVGLFTNGLDGVKKALSDWVTIDLAKFGVDFVAVFTNAVTNTINEVKRMYNELVGHSIIPDMMTEIWRVITTKIGEIKTFWKEKLSDMTSAMKGLETSVTESVSKIATSFKLFADKTPSMVSAVSSVRSEVDRLRSSVNDLTFSMWLLVAATKAASWAGVDVDSIPGFAAGGAFGAGSPMLVGENGPEIIMPKVPGFVFPNNMTNAMASLFSKANPVVNAQPVINNIDNSVHISVDANYRNVQSEASIRYDISAALAAIGR